MQAHDLGNFMLSLNDNPTVCLWKWTDKGTRFRHLNIAGGRKAKGYVYLSQSEFDSTKTLKEAEKKGMEDVDEQVVIDFSKIIKHLLENKKMLPAFIGIDKNFDKIIAEKLKEKNEN